MDTCSEKRTLGGLVLKRAFLAALIKADLGDLEREKESKKTEKGMSELETEMVYSSK